MTMIEIRFRIPSEPSSGNRQFDIQFTHWFPLSDTDALQVEDEGVKIKIHFDFKCIGNIGVESPEKIPNWVNVFTGSILVTSTVEVSEDLFIYMRDKNYKKPPDPALSHLEDEYFRLAEKVHDLAIKRVNRLIAYAKHVHGFFSSIPLGYPNCDLQSLMVRYRAGFRVAGQTDWKEFGPQRGGSVRVQMIAGRARYIAKEDWDSVRAFVASDEKIPGYKEVLSAAKMLASFGFLRSAVTEAVSALENCVNRLGSKAGSGSKLKNIRQSAPDLASHIKHLGFTCSFGVLIPLVLHEGVIADEDHAKAKEAITIRHNVVHNLQTSLDGRMVMDYIYAIERICDSLYQL